jgi:hypothetical protein
MPAEEAPIRSRKKVRRPDAYWINCARMPIMLARESESAPAAGVRRAETRYRRGVARPLSPEATSDFHPEEPDMHTSGYKPHNITVWGGVLLTVALALAGAPASAEVSWTTVEDYGYALALERNSHATAGAWMADYWDLRKPQESDKKLIATCWVYMQHCDCGTPGKPTWWQVREGMEKLCTARGWGGTYFKEKVRFSAYESEKAGWDDYVERIDGGYPVLVTYCYADGADRDLDAAGTREKDCHTMVGVGYLEQDGDKYLICHDGITSEQDYPAAVDCVQPGDLGLPTRGRPWTRSGTALYRWDGQYENLIMVFMSKPRK